MSRRLPTRANACARRLAGWALTCAIALTGCNTMEGEDSMQLGSQDYARAFDACIETGRDQGMPPSLADRGNGIIETEPRSIGSLFEPWRTDSSGPEQTLQSTVQYERRRVRFVFVPADFQPDTIDGKGPFNGAAQPDSPTDRARFDLETYEGILELRTRVFIERGFVPGIRTSTWSSTLTTTTTEPRPRGRDDGTDRMPTQWTPIGRDEAAERTMMRAVRARLSESTQGAEAVTSGQTADAPSS
jgi:hypothetical protein